jgi:hypothetical protein
VTTTVLTASCDQSENVPVLRSGFAIAGGFDALKAFFRSCVLLVSVLGIASPMRGQDSATRDDPSKMPCMEALGDQQAFYATGKPFVGTWSDTTTETLQDGTKVSNLSFVVTVARNSSGKVYVEGQPWPPNEIPNPSTVKVPGSVRVLRTRNFWVDDPVSGTMYSWSEPIKVVTLIHYAGVNSRERQEQERIRKASWSRDHAWAVPVCATYGLDSAYDSDEFSIRNLGTSQILGIDAEGIRATRNSDSVMEERWYSPDLQIALITRVDDARGDTSVREIKSLKQSEPDPDLFRIPAGYAIKEWSVSTDRNH